MRDPEAGPTALYVQVKDWLRSEIINGRFRPFDQLPSESALTDRFAVSRITVRQALNDLQKEGLIFKVHGKGSFVSKPKADQTLSSLQGFAEAMQEGGHEIYNRLLDLRELPANGVVAEKLRCGVGTPVVEIRRLRFLNRSPISVDVTYVPAHLGERLAKADLTTRDIFLILENDFGIPLGNAELVVEASGADETTAELLEVQPGAAVLKIERLTYTRDGQPIDFEYLFYRGDAFRYRLSVQRQVASAIRASR